jgi:hypothetical protein
MANTIGDYIRFWHVWISTPRYESSCGFEGRMSREGCNTFLQSTAPPYFR